MNLQERELLTTFLSNLGVATVSNPDQEALSMIRNALSGKPDAAYLLVQQALLQQAALSQAQARIGALEAQIRRAPATAADSSFLGGGRGWSTPLAPGAVPRGPSDQGPAVSAAMPAMPSRSSGVGDFLRGAAATAAGVAGGAMLFQGIENLFGGHHGGSFLGGQAPIAGAPEIVENTTVIDEYQGADYRVGSDNGFLGSRDLGDVGGPDSGPDPFDGMDPFADSGIDGDPSDWV